MDPINLDSLAEETGVFYEGNGVEHGTAMLACALPAAVKAIVQLAMFSDSERIRLSAAQFIVNRVLPKVGDGVGKEGESALAELLGEVVHEIPSGTGRD